MRSMELRHYSAHWDVMHDHAFNENSSELQNCSKKGKKIHKFLTPCFTFFNAGNYIKDENIITTIVDNCLTSSPFLSGNFENTLNS
jgi:hypothetical protein